MNEIERKIIDEYTAIHKDLETWGKQVDTILCEKLLAPLIANSVVKINPKFRLKSPKSYLFKVLYRKQKYKNPLVEILDKVGTRVVLLKSDQIAKVADMIMQYDKWYTKLTKGMKDGIEDQPRVFDYQSCHIVVWPKEDYKANRASNEMLACEIQIRTLLQHAFAEVSHDST
ncbi:MAG: RelA/SpoT domain-containing protein, partial [Chitinophagaceae bacterium]|nr:RelA/SpoT domain-containing protein [Chitinophagaceae bacterium]